MLKWLLTLSLAVVALGVLSPGLRRMGLGRLPGDIVIERNGKRYYFPIASTLLLSAAAGLLFRIL